MRRRSTARWLAPLAFLAAVTIAALLVRSGLQHGKQAQSTTTSTTHVQPGHKRAHHPKHAKKKAHGRSGDYYRVASGDTFSSIALKLGTTSAQLEALNPGVDPSALYVGERIRVK